MDKRKIYVLYHYDCVDGLAAGWLMKKYFPEAICMAVKYGELPPEMYPGSDVYIVDFSYPGKIIADLFGRGYMVTVYDHHKAAIEQLKQYFTDYEGIWVCPHGIRLVLDETRSGAGIVYDQYKSSQTWSAASSQFLIDCIQDRDLWKFKNPDSKLVHAAITTFPLTFETLDKLSVMDPSEIREIGRIALEKDKRLIEWHLANSVQLIEYDGATVPAINAPRYIVNEVASELTGQYPFVIGYYDKKDGRHIAFRSTMPDGADVNDFAEALGGGGHPTAASAVIPLSAVIPKKPTWRRFIQPVSDVISVTALFYFLVVPWLKELIS